jgi:hypothetical protein
MCDIHPFTISPYDPCITSLTSLIGSWLWSYDHMVIVVEDSYDGPRYDGDAITLEFVTALIERFKVQKRLHRRYIAIFISLLSLLFIIRY